MYLNIPANRPHKDNKSPQQYCISKKDVSTCTIKLKTNTHAITHTHTLCVSLWGSPGLKTHKVEYFQNSWQTQTKTWLDLEGNSPSVTVSGLFCQHDRFLFFFSFPQHHLRAPPAKTTVFYLTVLLNNILTELSFFYFFFSHTTTCPDWLTASLLFFEINRWLSLNSRNWQTLHFNLKCWRNLKWYERIIVEV